MLGKLNLQGEPLSFASSQDIAAKQAAALGPYGEIIHFPYDDPIGRAIKMYGEWAQIEVDFLCGLIGRGSTVLDVGANIGTHSIAFSRHVGPTGTVHAFEPRAAVFDLLTRNLVDSESSNVDASRVAVADAPGEMIIPAVDCANRVNVGSVAWLPKPAPGAEPKTKVRTITIDGLDLERCDLVKIDVEGMEPLVLKGMGDTVSRLQPLIYCDCNTIEAAVDLLRLLPQAYQAFLVRCPAFNEKNALKASENIFGFACETSLLFAPSNAVHLVRNKSTCGAEIILVRTFDELAKALLATPRYGDKSWFERDPVRLNVEVSTLAAALAERNLNLLEITQSHMQAAQQIDQLRETSRATEQAKRALQDRADALGEQLDLKDGENARLHFRSENLTRCLRTADEKFERASEAKEAVVQELARVRNELDDARLRIEANTYDLADHRHRLAHALTQSEERSEKIAVVCAELDAARSLIDANTYDLADHRHRLAHALAQSEERSERIAVVCAELDATRSLIDAKTYDLADHRHKLALALTKIEEQSEKLAIACRALDVARSTIETNISNLAELRAKLAALSQGQAQKAKRFRRLSRLGNLGAVLDPSRRDYRLIAASGLFDRQWYLERNRDVAETGVDPLRHYLRVGASEHRDPSPHFSTAAYTAANPDVTRSGINPLAHYVRHGQREGRPVEASHASTGSAQ